MDPQILLDDMLVFPKSTNNDAQLDNSESENVDIDALVKEKECGEDYCFGCDYSFGIKSTSINEKLERVYRLNLEKVTEETLALELSKAQVKEFVVPSLKTDKKIAPWTVESVLRHLRYHMVDSFFHDIKLIKRLHVLEEEIQNCIVTKNTDGQKSIKDKNVAALEKIVKMRVDANERIKKHKS
jgi:hypothetical protein